MTAEEPAGRTENNAQATEKKHLLLLTGITLLCLLPFLNKAYHIDDTLFVWCGKQIQHHWFDPYGFSVNWFGIQAPMSEVMRNPPLTPYYIAIGGSIAGWSEIALHAAFLLPALAAVLGIYVLAKRWCENPLLASLISLFTPAFLVSGTTVMCDVMMLAFEVWTFVFWIRAHEERNNRYFILSALLLTGCVLTKFTGLTIIPLLLVYSYVNQKKLILPNLYLIVPIILLIAYLLAFNSMYGGESLLGALTNATSPGATRPPIFSTLVVGLCFTGGCFLPVLFFAPLLWSRKIVIGAGIIIAILVVLVAAEGLFSGLTLQKVSIAPPVLGVQLLLFCLSGLLLLVLTAKELIRFRDPASLTLGLLILGTLLFTIFISWSISARYLLPLTPAVGILIVRGLGEKSKERLAYFLIIPAAAITLLVTIADYSIANSARTAAEDIASKYSNPNSTLWFQGHWGFQYYMELLGAKPLDGQNSEAKPGELVVYPLNNSLFPMDRNTVKSREKLEYPVLNYAATMSPSVGAAFYAHVRGPFPFAFGDVAEETYYILEIRNQ